MTKLYFCVPCKMPICPECFLTEQSEHHGHAEITKLSDEYEKASQLIAEKISAIDLVKEKHATELARLKGDK